MILRIKHLLLLSLVWAAACSDEEEEEPVTEVDQMKAELKDVINNVYELKKALTELTKQTMLQQFAVEERSRTSANSGIQLIRSRKRGLKNYESPSHVGFSLYAIHDHANYIRTIGMGEVAVTMNGVEFRTRHNDYKLVMPSTESTEYHALQDIPFPEVPPSVTGTVEEQAAEMAQWFKAFKDQNKEERDYTKYFKPVLCYMEGAWTLDKTLREPFKSERHHIDASSWFDLQEKVKFSAMSGIKNPLENLAYLPTTIASVDEEIDKTEYAQWNYRILCKPIGEDIPTSNLQYVDDLAYRMKDRRTVEKTLLTRATRFKLYDKDMSDDYNIMDKIFYKVPGMDNVPDPNMKQETFGSGDVYDVAYPEENVLLRTGFYHRQYKYAKKGAMGLTVNPRGFNDENRWVAQTNQSQVAPVCLEKCQRELQPNGKRPLVCKPVCNRFTYAIPLEIVYLTPLLTWNPYNLHIHQDHKSAVRNGGDGRSKPFDGADLNRYYLTPAEMFGKTGERDAADTTKGSVRILDSGNTERRTVASGTRIWTDEIPGVGRVRLRYPIAPVAGEGSSVWKELNALKDLVSVLTGAEDTPDKEEQEFPPEVEFQMEKTIIDPPGEHIHDLKIPTHLVRDRLLKGKAVEVTTRQGQGHTHDLIIRYDKNNARFYYNRCDGKRECWDGHPNTIILVSDIDLVALRK